MRYETPAAVMDVVTQFALDGYGGSVVAETGLVGTIGVRIRDNAGANFLARTTSGIVEDIAGSGIYRASLTAPSTAGQYTIVWDDGSGGYRIEELTVQYSAFSATAAARAYISVESLKNTLGLADQSYADNDIAVAINAASRAIDRATSRRFYLDDDNTSVRLYTPDSHLLIAIDDIVDVQSVLIDRLGNGTFGEAWTLGTDFVMQPSNAPADDQPYEFIHVRRHSPRWFPRWLEDSVKVTGQFGWPVLPDLVVQATTILAGKLLRRSREAPFGIVTYGTIDTASAIRIARTDPDVASLLADLSRRRPFV